MLSWTQKGRGRRASFPERDLGCSALPPSGCSGRLGSVSCALGAQVAGVSACACEWVGESRWKADLTMSYVSPKVWLFETERPSSQNPVTENRQRLGLRLR